MSRKKKSSSTENVETHTRPLITRKLAYWNEVSEREVGMVEVSEKRSGRLYYAKVLVFGVEWDSFMSWHMTRDERTQVIKTNGTEEREGGEKKLLFKNHYISVRWMMFSFLSAALIQLDPSALIYRLDGRPSAPLFSRHFWYIRDHTQIRRIWSTPCALPLSYDGIGRARESEGKWAILIAFKRDIERQHEADTKQSLNSNSEKFQFSDIHTRVTQAGSRSLSLLAWWSNIFISSDNKFLHGFAGREKLFFIYIY